MSITIRDGDIWERPLVEKSHLCTEDCMQVGFPLANAKRNATDKIALFCSTPIISVYNANLNC